MNGRGRFLFSALMAALAPGLAWCDGATRYSLLVGGEAWMHPERGGHGLVMAAADRYGMTRNGHLGLEYNTDTVRLSADGFGFHGGLLEIGAAVEGQARYAGLLPDYYRRGRLDEDRGLWASHAAAQVRAKLNPPGNHHPELSLGARQWWFSRRGETADGFALPPDTRVLELRLHHTWWRLRDDAAWRDRHRSYPRLVGMAAGVSLGLDWRARTRPWGARDASVFAPVDGRNDPRNGIAILRQWARAGRELRNGWRAQMTQLAAWGRGEDDITRLRIGGLNPYVASLSGAPWAAWLSDRVLAVSASLHRHVGVMTEAGVGADIARVDDASRTGKSAAATLRGFSAFVDARPGHAQVDARLGWTPDAPGGDGGQISAYVAAGYCWD